MRSLSIFIATLLFLFLAIIYTSCKKEYSYEGGIAVFTFLGDGGNCTNPVINGTYSAGIALQPSNNIQLQVNVTTIGAYGFSTNSVNGIKFTASGSFTVLGVQTITLTGNGKPVSAGNFSYIPPIGMGCTFLVTVGTAMPEVARFTLQGSPDTCSNFKISGTYMSGVTLKSDNTVEVIVDVTSPGSYSITTDTLDGISFLAAGNFTTTGTQKIILTGSGTPSMADNLTFSPHTGSSTCTFNLTVVTPGPPATYVLESNQDGSCTGYSVSGNFFSGQALTNTNTMAVKVTVTVLGNYAINTNTVNGITFTGTGSFVTLGSQIVVLTGTGTPAQKGTFTFIPQIIGPHPIGGETCSASVQVM